MNDEWKNRSRPDEFQVISRLEYWHGTALTDDLEENTEQFWLHQSPDT